MTTLYYSFNYRSMYLYTHTKSTGKIVKSPLRRVVENRFLIDKLFYSKTLTRRLLPVVLLRVGVVECFNTLIDFFFHTFKPNNYIRICTIVFLHH